MILVYFSEVLEWINGPQIMVYRILSTTYEIIHFHLYYRRCSEKYFAEKVCCETCTLAGHL